MDDKNDNILLWIAVFGLGYLVWRQQKEIKILMTGLPVALPLTSTGAATTTSSSGATIIPVVVSEQTMPGQTISGTGKLSNVCQ